MKIAIIGAGFVGLTSGAIFADLGHKVWIVRRDSQKIEMLKRGEISFYEPDLGEIVKRNVEAGRLIPTTSYKEAVPPAEVVFICVGTPSLPSGEVDMSQVYEAAREIGQNLLPPTPPLSSLGRQGKGTKIIVVKSTVPIGTAGKVEKIIKENALPGVEFEMASAPEFLRQGSAVYDTLNPDRIVIGTNGDYQARKILLELHKSFPGQRALCDIKTAEMIKYASNAYLATSISFINSLANLCEKVGADVTKVAEGMRLDRRIGKYAFLNAGCGYGGSCLPKDIKALMSISKMGGVSNELLEAVETINARQKEMIVEKILSLVEGVKAPLVGIWGLSFKPGTDDLREAVSLYVIEKLLCAGAEVKVYDPAAIENMKKFFPQIKYAPDCFKAAEGVHCLAIITEWAEFKELDKSKLKAVMAKPNIVDGRNIYDPDEMRKLGFNYLSIGRPCLQFEAVGAKIN